VKIIINDINMSEYHTISGVISAGLVYLTLILLGCFGVFIIKRIFKKCPGYASPSSLYWFILGVVLSLIVYLAGDCGNRDCSTIDNYFIQGFYNYVIKADSHFIYVILLPPLLYESSLGTNIYKFNRLLLSSIFLATVGVGVAVVLIGLMVRYVINGLSTWSQSFLMASVLASTDPVAVLSVLKTLGFPEKILTIFEGESLLNDGSSVVLFHILLDVTKGRSLTALDVISNLFYMCVVSPLFGVLYAAVTSIIARFLHHTTSLFEAIWFTLNCSIVFIVAETFLHMSGPLASVAYGLYTNVYGYRSLDRNSVEEHHSFVTIIATVSEMLIFILSGAMLASLLVDSQDLTTSTVISVILDGALTWLFMLIARLDMFALAPLLSLMGPYQISMKESTLFWWGGLRGAIVLALANMLYQDEELPKTFSAAIPVRIAVAVAFNLIVQGQLFAVVVKLVNPYKPEPHQKEHTLKTIRYIDDDFKRCLKEKLRDSGLTVAIGFDVDASTVGTIHLTDLTGYPTSVAKALFSKWSSKQKHQEMLYKAESMLVRLDRRIDKSVVVTPPQDHNNTYHKGNVNPIMKDTGSLNAAAHLSFVEGTSVPYTTPEQQLKSTSSYSYSNDSDIEKDTGASDDKDSVFQALRGQDLTEQQLRFIQSIKGAMKFKCGLGLRMFLPQYIGIVACQNNDSNNIITDIARLEQDCTNTRPSNHNVIIPSESCDSWMVFNEDQDKRRGDFINWVLNGLPTFSSFALDSRGNIKYLPDNKAHDMVASWVKECRVWGTVLPIGHDFAQRFLEDSQESMPFRSYKNKITLNNIS